MGRSKYDPSGGKPPSGAYTKMNRIIRSTAAILFVCLFFCGGYCEAESAKARLTQDKVLVLANREAKRSGYDLSKYETPKASFRQEDRTWNIHYEGEKNVPGNHFVVWVDDLTGECKIHRGR